MSIVVRRLTYNHVDKETLFQALSFSVKRGQKVALIGNNGTGKSTLMRIISGELIASSGEIICEETPYYVPQHFGQYDHLTVAEALRIDKKLTALQAITEGNVSEENFTELGEDWDIEERALTALADWGLSGISLFRPLASLSGGEKTRVLLAGIHLHLPEIILLDEPTNHLDCECRERLYEFIRNSKATIVVISHDRVLLNLLSSIYELDKKGVTFYNGNYDIYKAQKDVRVHALYSQLDEKEKELRQAHKVAQETAERKQKLDARGERRSAKKRVSRMAMNTLRDRAEKSTSAMKGVHEEKQRNIAEKLTDIRADLPDIKSMKVDFNNSSLHAGKTLITARQINFSYSSSPLWKRNLDFLIKSGDRVLIRGRNGSGKTTLLRLMTGEIPPSEGVLTIADFQYVYLDQEYSIIRDDLSVFEQVRQFTAVRQEHEIKMILNRFLFPLSTWDKSCTKLSGGEKMKLALCCLMVRADTPDIFMLDEPTNNIDIQNVEILTATVKDFRGTVLLISHDTSFIEEIGIDYTIEL
ncbi:ribosomal protection-like ABC-F family protein [uncultured Sanguibacteroides sp.]|uniref:ribosomal protection-like ABC-F family protein n=1 Tax=uncultured Sanguibacteroides sp. TaxID=1635151 RepID=UPI0025DE2D91|nr:ABC-F family ATP-binding cassette domain-containing protein [uncultured Sanguibacteroides sp.]